VEGDAVSEHNDDSVARWRALPRVYVVCTDPSHQDRQVKVAMFQSDPLMDEPWTQVSAFRQDTWQVRPMDPEVFQGQHHQNLMCKLCGLKVSAKPRTLDPVLDRLHAAGVASIELRHLAGIISS
jgi:hypothetical protein